MLRYELQSVTMDSGLAVHGTVSLEYSSLVLKNLGALDAMSYGNSVLSLYWGSTLVEAVKVVGVADLASCSNGSNGVLNSTYSAGTLTVHDGSMDTLSHTAGVGAVTGLALHA